MSTEINKNNLTDILKDLGKEYRKLNGKTMPAEIVIVGGAAILAKYGFRDASYDVDAIIRASSSLKDAALSIGDKYGLEHNWLNSDFKNTDSYSEKLYQHSKHFRTFANVLEVRIVEPEYLLATKLKSARPYKHDFSDIIGIITEEKEINPDFSKQMVMAAYQDMYGSIPVDPDGQRYMNEAFSTTTPETLIKQVRKSEENAKNLLQNFQTNYPDTLNESNINNILQTLTVKNTMQKPTTNNDCQKKLDNLEVE